jgi:hypothetical protein
MMELGQTEGITMGEAMQLDIAGRLASGDNKQPGPAPREERKAAMKRAPFEEERSIVQVMAVRE